MKKIRLKDKMWFGKYSGARISDVLLKDRKVLDELCAKGLIEYDEKIISFLSNHYDSREKRTWGLGGTPRYETFTIEDPIPAPEPYRSRTFAELQAAAEARTAESVLQHNQELHTQTVNTGARIVSTGTVTSGGFTAGTPIITSSTGSYTITSPTSSWSTSYTIADEQAPLFFEE